MGKERIGPGELGVVLGLFIRSARGERTQGWVADKMGVKPPMVSLWESGRRGIELERMPRLCDHLGLSLAASLRQMAQIAEERARRGEALPVTPAGPPRRRVAIKGRNRGFVEASETSAKPKGDGAKPRSTPRAKRSQRRDDATARPDAKRT